MGEEEEEEMVRRRSGARMREKNYEVWTTDNIYFSLTVFYRKSKKKSKYLDLHFRA